MQKTKIKSIRKLTENFDKYDLEIDSTHCFFANNILVHNCRCVTIVDVNCNARFFSRQGKEFFTLGKVAKDIKELGLIEWVLDGEICLIKDNGDDDFQGIMKQIRKKDHTIQNPRYKIFDILTPEEFKAQKSDAIASFRYAWLASELPSSRIEGTSLSVLPQTLIKSNEHFKALRAEAREKNWEGLILRKDVGYEGKRTDRLVKVKDFIDDEYKVTRITSNVFRTIVEQREVEELVMDCAYIVHKGTDVGVGSGFSLEERQLFHAHPELIVDKIITVRYFEETLNEQGNYSLRFPTFKGFREEGE